MWSRAEGCEKIIFISVFDVVSLMNHFFKVVRRTKQFLEKLLLLKYIALTSQRTLSFKSIHYKLYKHASVPTLSKLIVSMNIRYTQFLAIKRAWALKLYKYNNKSCIFVVQLFSGDIDKRLHLVVLLHILLFHTLFGKKNISLREKNMSFWQNMAKTMLKTT